LNRCMVFYRTQRFFVYRISLRSVNELTAQVAFVSMTNPVNDSFQGVLETKALVFVNPVAGMGRARRSMSRVRAGFEQQRISAEFVLTVSAGELESRARDAVASGARLLFAMGGDGTVQALVNAVCTNTNREDVTRAAQTPQRREVVLGILPSGGGNDFATALGLPQDPAAAVAIAATAAPRLVDLLRARTADGADRIYVGGGGVGLDVEAARHAAGAFRRWPGRLRYVASALRAWSEFSPLSVRAEFPEDDLSPIESRAFLAGVLNAPSYGAGLRVAPTARIDDGLLDLSIVKDLSVTQVAALVPRLLVNGKIPSFYLTHQKARCVVLQADRACMFHGDGEIIGPAPVRIDVVPAAVKFLAPSGV
jgi:diacylglycerol kinase (ATP)